jgi:hypothetical protein
MSTLVSSYSVATWRPQAGAAFICAGLIAATTQAVRLSGLIGAIGGKGSSDNGFTIDLFYISAWLFHFRICFFEFSALSEIQLLLFAVVFLALFEAF